MSIINLSEKNLSLILDYQSGNEAALEELVKLNKGLVLRFALKYKNYGLPLDDLTQQGYIGLIKAAQKYTEGEDVTSHLTSWISNSVTRYCEMNSSFFRVTKSNLSVHLFYNKKAVREFLEEEDGEKKAEFIDRIKEKGYSEKDIERSIEEASMSVVSLDQPFKGSDGGNLYDLVSGGNPEEDFIKNDLKSKLRKIVKHFITDVSERDAFILQKRYFSEDPMTLDEIGQIFGISRERVRQIEKLLLSRLKKRFKNTGMTSDLMAVA